MLNDTGSTLFNHKAQALEYDPQMHPLKFTDDIRTCASEYPAGRLQVIGYNGTALTDWFIEDCSLLQYTGTQTRLFGSLRSHLYFATTPKYNTLVGLLPGVRQAACPFVRNLGKYNLYWPDGTCFTDPDVSVLQ
jgi:hypothetical protein